MSALTSLENISITINPQNNEIPLISTQQFLDIEITGKGHHNVSTKKAICLVIDKSGSMDGLKLEEVKKSAFFIVKNLSKDDMFAVITYDSNVNTLIPLTKLMTNDDYEKIPFYNKIKSIMAGSCTNLSGGLYEGVKTISQIPNSNYIKTIFLLTDGIINEGDKDPDNINSTVNFLKADSNITIHSFGLGADHESEKLNKISDTFFYIENPDKSAEAFADRLGSVISTIAQNVYITITPEPNTTIKLCSPDILFVQHENKTKIHFKNIEHGSRKNIIIQTTFPVVDTENVYNYLNIKLEYTNMLATTPTLISSVQTELIQRKKYPITIPNIKLDEQLNRIKLIEYFKTVQIYLENKQIEDSKNILLTLKDELQKSISCISEFTLQLIKIVNDHIKYINSESNNIAMFTESIVSQSRQTSGGNNQMYITPTQRSLRQASQNVNYYDINGVIPNDENSDDDDMDLMGSCLTQEAYPE